MEKAYTFNDVNLIPKFSRIYSRGECDTGTTFCGVPLSMPLVPANMQAIVGKDMLKTMNDYGSIGIMHRFNGWFEELESAMEDPDSTALFYGASVGINNTEEELDKLFSLTQPPAFILIDVAHGHHMRVDHAIGEVKETVDGIPIVAGNVATKEGALFLAECGVDAIKVGVGNGSLCETRIRTGMGIPQFSANQNISRALQEADMGDIQIIADGGVESPGDVAKAIGAGADLVMSGNFFSGTKETPLSLLKSGDWKSPTLYKQYMGSASYAAKHENGAKTQHIEGNAKLVPYRGSCVRIMQEVENGLKSAMSYVGARNIKEFQAQASFVLVTHNGTREATPYLLG